tara:strand:- start:380 stop:547 length:168 start_codon:yes stop_codon:yes gene_type:complete
MMAPSNMKRVFELETSISTALFADVTDGSYCFYCTVMDFLAFRRSFMGLYGFIIL